MKLRRFTSAGVEMARQYLAAVKESGDVENVTLNGQPFTRAELISSPAYSDAIPALADLDLDETRVFDTTFSFCEYFDSLIHDHNPQSYREDVGFWTWLAFVYLPQLVKTKCGKAQVGAAPRLIFEASSHVNAHRHLMVFPYYLYAAYRTKPELTKAVLVHPINSVSDLVEQIIGRQYILQNQAYLHALNILYLRADVSGLKKGAGGDGPGAVRRFVDMVDQFGMTRDFHEEGDAGQFVALLPKEFSKFKD